MSGNGSAGSHGSTQCTIRSSRGQHERRSWSGHHLGGPTVWTGRLLIRENLDPPYAHVARAEQVSDLPEDWNRPFCATTSTACALGDEDGGAHVVSRCGHVIQLQHRPGAQWSSMLSAWCPACQILVPGVVLRHRAVPSKSTLSAMAAIGGLRNRSEKSSMLRVRSAVVKAMSTPGAWSASADGTFRSHLPQPGQHQCGRRTAGGCAR